MLRNTLTLGAAAFVVASLGLSGAMAADLPTKKEAPAYIPPVPVYNWTGFYVGANLGVNWANGSRTITGSPLFLTGVVGPLGIPTSGYGNNKAGFFGGVQAGYNYQVNSAVFGAETDIQWTALNGNGTYTSAQPVGTLGNVTTSVGARMNWLGTTRLRAGFLPTDRFLVYLTGGLAYGGGNANATVSGNGPLGAVWTGSTSTTRIGWTLGGGGEYAITNNVTLRGEYLYYNLGTQNNTTTPNAIAAANFPNVYATTSTQFQGSLIRAGVNYKF